MIKRKKTKVNKIKLTKEQLERSRDQADKEFEKLVIYEDSNIKKEMVTCSLCRKKVPKNTVAIWEGHNSPTTEYHCYDCMRHNKIKELMTYNDIYIAD